MLLIKVHVNLEKCALYIFEYIYCISILILFILLNSCFPSCHIIIAIFV